MTQSPYAQLGSEYVDMGPRRTSVMAIISLVLAIVSVVPLFCVFIGSGAVAMMFGGAALLMIHKERGRLGGTGLAATGIIIGVLVTVVQITGVIAMSQAMGFFKQQLVGPVEQSLKAIDQGDFTTARKLFTPEADAKITDEMLTEFAASYKKDFGSFVSTPNSILDAVKSYVSAGRAMQQIQNQGGNAFPFPAHFANTDVMVVVVWDPARMQKGSGPNFAFPTVNIGLLAPDGRSAWINEIRPGPGPVQFQIKPPPPPPPVPAAPSAAPAPASPSPSEGDKPATGTPAPSGG